MFSQSPLRSIRQCALPRQCSGQPRWHRSHKRLSMPKTRAFSSTPQTAISGDPETERRRRIRAAQSKIFRNYPLAHPAPQVTHSNWTRSRNDKSKFPADLGIFDDTIIRAPFSKLPPIWHKTTRKYLWQWIFGKLKSLASRSSYRQCIQKTGWNKYFPIDIWNRKYLRDMAKRYYVKTYQNFAKGNMSTLNKFCVEPLCQKFNERLRGRGSLKLKWELKEWKSVRIVSDRVASLGRAYPDTVYRQLIVRLESIQSLQVASKSASANKNNIKSEWMPRGAKSMLEPSNKTTEVPEREIEQKVVEYLVMQRRVLWGDEEKWKVQGFADESTPESIEKDEAHQWRHLQQELEAAEKIGDKV